MSPPALSPSPATRLPPLQPTYVLRGHAAAVHAVTFVSGNTRLATGDAEGWVVVWDVVTKRADAVWRAHREPVLGLAAWPCDYRRRSRTLGRTQRSTLGRDQSRTQSKVQGGDVLRVVTVDDGYLSKVLPAADHERGGGQTCHRPAPWMLHALEVNTLNFCSFALCLARADEGREWRSKQRQQHRQQGHDEHEKEQEQELEEKKQEHVPSLEQQNQSWSPILIAVPGGLDSGGIDIFELPSERRAGVIRADKSIKTGMVMALGLFWARSDSLRVVAGYESGHTMVFEHDLVDAGAAAAVRRVYTSQPHSQPVLSLAITPSQEHYFTSSADAVVAKHPLPVAADCRRTSPSPSPETVRTGHSGQQGLVTRSDGELFATAGWDARFRVYAVRPMKELAVLKWHEAGCYTTAFAEVRAAADGSGAPAEDRDAEKQSDRLVPTAKTQPSRPSQTRRSEKATSTHWLAGGSKDGKVSLWEVY